MKRKIIAICLLVLVIVGVHFGIQAIKDKKAPELIFGDIVVPGSYYNVIYKDDPQHYYQLGRGTSQQPASFGIAQEEFINAIGKTQVLESLLGETILTARNSKEYIDFAKNISTELYSKIDDYDVKIVNYNVGKDDKVTIVYKMYVIGESWIVTDAEGTRIAGDISNYGKTLYEMSREQYYRKGFGGQGRNDAPEAGKTWAETH